jgi:hypothetical protein
LPTIAAVRRSAGRNQRLVHVQSDREGAVDAGDAQRRLIREQWPVSAGGDGRLDFLLRTAEVREAIDALGQLSHDPLLAAGQSSPVLVPRQGSRHPTRL